MTSTERLANGRFVFSICDPQSIDGYCELAVSDPTGARRRTILAEDGGVYSEADWSPDGTKIAFSLVVGNRYMGYTADIWVANPDGSGLHRPVTEPEVDRLSPAWSPDGTKLAFAQGKEIYVVDADGSDRRLLTVGFDPAWSPDGTKIVFGRGVRGSRSDLYVVKADGSGARRLTRGPGIDVERVLG